MNIIELFYQQISLNFTANELKEELLILSHIPEAHW